jgi:hypothetical protein
MYMILFTGRPILLSQEGRVTQLAGALTEAGSYLCLVTEARNQFCGRPYEICGGELEFRAGFLLYN